MLKRLELVGFKSFADKTQFDFTAGITAIVGPNGSGKSNIVDAVRWILGEQSAKSLRGGEMADVIFNGSASRRSLGLAEVTMTFDNSRHILATEAAEVQITRRVYRGGEGEYLINNQICRLRDIKELFLGSGAGTDAYCIIEQGRVDVLLQSSTKERRIIFEEAAGISRFKAKKNETLRKLERVDQNVLRLKDIIDEVEKQLRSVKLQAAKAQRYQEYSGRLKELRVELSLEEYRDYTARLQTESAILEELRAALKEQTAQAEVWDHDSRRLEAMLLRLEEETRERESHLAQARQQIASEETTLGHERALTGELEADLSNTRKRMTELNMHVAALAESAARATNELQGVELLGNEQRQGVQALEEELKGAVQRLNQLHSQQQGDKTLHLELMHQAARLHNDVVSYKAQVDNLHRECDRLRVKTEQAAEHLATLDVDLQELAVADETLQQRLSRERQTLADHRQERERLHQRHTATNQRVADLKAQRSGLASRIEVLERLERSHEGLGTGVREVIALREQSNPGPWQTILGMVADLFTVRHEYAPLIDLALGERSQRFLVRDAGELEKALGTRAQPFSGRVSFVPLRLGSPITDMASSSTEGLLNDPGVVARADQLVTCEQEECRDLPAQLLGQTYIVRDLDTARRLAAQSQAHRLVTLKGELLETDGTLTVGTHHAETGILSRKSELRELRQQIVALAQRVAAAEREWIELGDQLAAVDRRVVSVQEEIDVLAEQAGDLRSRISQHRQRREVLHEEVTLSRREISSIESEMQSQESAWRQAKEQAEDADHRVQELQSRLEHADLEIRALDQQRQHRQQQVAAAQVALATVEERLSGLRAKHRQIEGDLDQRRHERLQGEQRLEAARTRLHESLRTMLNASSALAHWYLEKESSERKVAELVRERDSHRQERQSLSDRAQTARNAWQQQQELAHASELKVNDSKHHLDSLAARLHEDYQIELAALYQQTAAAGRWQETPIAAADATSRTFEKPAEAGEIAAEPPITEQPPVVGLKLDPAAAQEEITELRRKLSRLGSVNLDSLQELADLETRAQTLQTQYDDLTAAKKSLEEIITAINNDSRRLFADIFAEIRTHFQELFRKLFGGGMADIVLEDEADILESGIEIIARPPGKELRSISLMSGGEKTMTAVALLLSIFRSKPSPFCILDEVDAALDEANIGRYTAVLREFLDRSQFIIITHSKRSMAAADVLYGITMQESGISKRVAVRFEDWEEENKPAANGSMDSPTKAVPAGNDSSFAGR